MSAAEFAIWQAFAARHGFPADRAEWASALAGSAVAATWGGKVRAKDLVPQFGPRVDDDTAIMAFFDSLTPERFGNGRD